MGQRMRTQILNRHNDKMHLGQTGETTCIKHKEPFLLEPHCAKLNDTKRRLNTGPGLWALEESSEYPLAQGIIDEVKNSGLVISKA